MKFKLSDAPNFWHYYNEDCYNKVKRDVPRMTYKAFFKYNGFSSIKIYGNGHAYLDDLEYTWFAVKWL